MKSPDPGACLDLRLLRYVRDEKPSPAALLAWLGASDASRYHVLRKVGLLVEENGRVALSPSHASGDGHQFRFGNRVFLLDEDRVLTV